MYIDKTLYVKYYFGNTYTIIVYVFTISKVHTKSRSTKVQKRFSKKFLMNVYIPMMFNRNAHVSLFQEYEIEFLSVRNMKR